MNVVSRRAALVGASAVAGSVVNLAVITATRPEEAPDAELRSLFAEYQGRVADWGTTYAAMRVPRAAVDAEYDAFVAGDFSDWRQNLSEFERLWALHGMQPLSRAWNEAGERMAETIQRIHATRATSPFGIAVKLAALPHYNFGLAAEDFSDATRSVLADLDAMLGGGEFSAAFVAAAGERFGGIPDDDSLK